MNFENCFPLWNDLNTTQKKIISDNLITQYVKKGTIIHNGNLDCTGLLLVKSGQLRTYIFSNEGREITLYQKCAKVPSQELSDYLVKELTKKEK